MAGTVQLKLEFENSIRRASVSSTETLAGFKRFISSFLDVEGCDVTYRDEEGDTITVGSDVELKQLLQAAQKENRVLRFTIVQTAQFVPEASVAGEQPEENEQEAEEEAPKEPEYPFANLARALAEPETVQRVQAVFQSPVITEAVTRFARAYTDTRGDTAVAGLVSAQHLPALLGVVAELVAEVPVMKDVQDIFMQQAFGRGNGAQEGPCETPFPFPGGPFGGPFAGPFGGMFGGCHPRGPGHHFGPHHPGHHGHHPGHHGHHGGPHHPDHHHGHDGGHHHRHPHHGGHHGRRGGGGCGQGMGHLGVFCDGCASDEQLKQTSVREGNMTHRGFIRGTRHKSQTVNDFDLCDSCKNNTARFPDSAYGPFTAMEPSQEQRKRFWGWQHRRPQPAEQQSWRQQPASESSSGSTSSGANQPERQPQEWDLMDTVKAAFEKGSQLFGDANKQGELSEIYKAVYESLQESKPNEQPKAAAREESPKVAPKASESQDPFVKWESQLRQLEQLGFDKLETYIQFLEEERGDLERVVNRIVRRDM